MPVLIALLLIGVVAALCVTIYNVLVTARNQIGNSFAQIDVQLTRRYLKANQNMLQVSEELTSTENRIAFARQAYNDSVLQYNNRREVFPNNLVAGTFGFTPGKALEIENIQSKRDAIQVKF